MKTKKILILLLASVLLMGGAGLLYSQLGTQYTPEQISVQEEPGTVESEDETASAGQSETVLAPDFTVYNQKGEPIHLHDYLGKPIVLNFWASWCGPCKMEMPDFQEKYLELGNEIHFLMINATGGRETVESAAAFIEEQAYTFPVFYDAEGNAAMTYGTYSLPTTYFIDAQGIPAARAIGAIDAATLQKGIDMIYTEK